jgi:hypothetical protein
MTKDVATWQSANILLLAVRQTLLKSVMRVITSVKGPFLPPT